MSIFPACFSRFSDTVRLGAKVHWVIHMTTYANLLEFTAQAMEDGFEEILQKEWDPNIVLDMHTHPYDVRVQVASGQVSLSLATGTQTYEAGQGFYLARNTEHAEHYGPQGAQFWVARKLS
jgi:quercetin dioxygenase-like cupin family protein